MKRLPPPEDAPAHRLHQLSRRERQAVLKKRLEKHPSVRSLSKAEIAREYSQARIARLLKTAGRAEAWVDRLLSFPTAPPEMEEDDAA